MCSSFDPLRHSTLFLHRRLAHLDSPHYCASNGRDVCEYLLNQVTPILWWIQLKALFDSISLFSLQTTWKVDSSSLFLSFLQEDTAKVISSMLMVSGLSTLLHSFFGSRLPLIQGASFVYLAPALAIIFSTELYGLKKDVRHRSPHYLTICICIFEVELWEPCPHHNILK